MKYLRLWMIVLVAIAGAVLFACGGDSNDEDNGNGNEPTAAATSGDGAEPTDDGSSANGDSNSELRALAARMGDNEAKIAYTFTAEGGGADATGSFTLFWKPPDNWRLDIDMDGSVSTVIEKEGTTYICIDDGSGGGTCTASPVGIPLPFLTYFTDPDALTGLIGTEVDGIGFDRSDKEIAGQDATCYSASGTVEGQSGSAEYCFSDEGLLLRLDGGGEGGSFTLEATSVEGTVADADFELPYEILDIDIPGQ